MRETDNDGLPGCIVLTDGRGNYVTIDMVRRIFGLGNGMPRGYTRACYSGRGWQERIRADAIKCLEDATA